MKRFLVALLVCFSGIAGAAPKHKPYWGYLVKIDRVWTNEHSVRVIEAHDELPKGQIPRRFIFMCNGDALSWSTPAIDGLYRTDVPKQDVWKCDNYMLCREQDPKCIMVCLSSVD